MRDRYTNNRLRTGGVNDAVWTTIRDLLFDSDTLAHELTAWAEQAASPRT